MTTTMIRNSIVGDEWIRNMMTAVPPQKVMKDGKWTGDILTGPVRLAFMDLFKLPSVTPTRQNPKFGATLLFPPGTDMALFYEEYYRICAENFASHWNGQQYVGLHSPFHDQGEKFKYDGFTTGAVYFTASSQYKPPVVTPIPGDPNNFNPVVDEARVYPGVWAICALNCYAYGVNATGPQKKGPGFGLQSVVIIGDDTNLAAGAAANPSQQFGGLALPAPIQRPNFGAIPGAAPGAPPVGNSPPPSLPGVPLGMPGVPQTITTTYRPAPPPPSPEADDDMSWMR